MAKRTAESILTTARELVKRKGSWTKGAHGRDSAGEAVSIKNATMFCTSGALRKASGFFTVETEAFRQAYTLMEKVTGVDPRHVCVWNDAPERTQADVLKAFTRAIKLAKKQNS